MGYEKSLAVIQSVVERPVYHIRDLVEVAGSRSSAYRVLQDLEELGIAKETARRGFFTVRSSAFQNFRIVRHLLPSLKALKEAKHFGKSYDESDIRLATRILDGFTTLDYKAYELTRLQTPYTLYIYVENIELSSKSLKSMGFSEGKKGRVAILAMEDKEAISKNVIQRVYLDCLANGGRSIMDAIAIEMKYGKNISVKGDFPVETVIKVQEELQYET